jgi:hypothetical protein
MREQSTARGDHAAGRVLTDRAFLVGAVVGLLLYWAVRWLDARMRAAGRAA